MLWQQVKAFANRNSQVVIQRLLQASLLFQVKEGYLRCQSAGVPMATHASTDSQQAVLGSVARNQTDLDDACLSLPRVRPLMCLVESQS